MNSIKFKKLLIYSERKNKYFCTTFSDQVNIVKGKNTSGKSTLIQSIIYSFGINDVNDKLSEILDLDVLFRIDFEIDSGGIKKEISFIRDKGTFFILEKDKSVLRFDGISGDSSNEHIKLKNTISSIFDFSLMLESKDSLKEAPIETIFLPYYISQSVGWVYLRESFSGLSFYKNFKQDYLDYYLGITTNIDRLKLQRLRKKKNELASEIDFLKDMITNNDDLKLSKLLDENFKAEATRYLQEYSDIRELLVKEERTHIKLCSQKSLAMSRRSVLYQVNRNIKKQRPSLDTCPVCVQTLPSSLENLYDHSQNVNDTKSELDKVKERVDGLQSKINSSTKKITEYNEKIDRDYSIIEKYISSNVTFSSWLNHKSNVKLISNINESIGNKIIELDLVQSDLDKVVGDVSVDDIRASKEAVFKEIFKRNLSRLGVKSIHEPRYEDLYKINSFPYQGVELHKTVMAYHFSLNELISKTEDIHRMPFVLDAILKEDIDLDSRESIFKFISSSRPSDTQVIFSVSESFSHSKESEENLNNVAFVNRKYFGGDANIIQIGDGDTKRSLLLEYDGSNKDYIKSTLEVVYSA